jgi:hypothetical protein
VCIPDNFARIITKVSLNYFTVVESYKRSGEKIKMAIIATVASIFTATLAVTFAAWMLTQAFKN